MKIKTKITLLKRQLMVDPQQTFTNQNPQVNPSGSNSFGLADSKPEGDTIVEPNFFQTQDEFSFESNQNQTKPVNQNSAPEQQSENTPPPIQTNPSFENNIRPNLDQSNQAPQNLQPVTQPNQYSTSSHTNLNNPSFGNLTQNQINSNFNHGQNNPKNFQHLPNNNFYPENQSFNTNNQNSNLEQSAIYQQYPNNNFNQTNTPPLVQNNQLGNNPINQQIYNSPGYYTPDQEFSQYDINSNYSTIPGEDFDTNLSQEQTPRFKPKFKINWLKILPIIGGALAVILVLSLLLYYFTGNNNNQTTTIVYERVGSSITAPVSLAQGTPGEWEVLIENSEPVDIANVKVILEFDDDFRYFKEINPTPDDPGGTSYSFARIDRAGGRSPSVKIRFEGILEGRVDVETVMQGKISYNPILANGQLGNETQVSIAPVRTKIGSPQVNLTLQPTVEEVQSGNQAEITLRIRNQTDRNLQDLRVRMSYPTGVNSFTYTSSEYVVSNNNAPQTQPDSGNDLWLIPRLPAGSEQFIKVRGDILGTGESKLTFAARIELQTGANEYQLMSEVFKDITVISQPVAVKTQFEGKDSDPTFRPGETVKLVVNYENQSQDILNDVKVTAQIEDLANILDLSTLQFSGAERGDLLGNEITWTGSRVPQLVTLRPRQSGSLSYQVKIKETAQFINVALDQSQYTLRPIAKISAKNLTEIEVAGELYKARGELIFEQTVNNKGRNENTGKDIFEITWTLKSLQNEITEAEIRVISPIPNVWRPDSITPRANKDAITYDPVSGEIVWSIGKMENYTGLENGAPVESISFELEADSKSQNEVLLQAPKATGIDIVTGQNFEVPQDQVRL